MIRLGVTQRVSVVPEYGERRDCLDQQWTALLQEIGYQPIPLPNTVENASGYLDSLSLDGVILTSGNDLSHLEAPNNPAPERDQFEATALQWAIDRGRPVLGVCRGLELINVEFGGTLSTVADHVALEHEIELHDVSNGVVCDGLDFPDRATVNSFHEYGIAPEGVAEALQIVATAPDGTVEGLIHERHPVCGIMWHPERTESLQDIDRAILTALFSDPNPETNDNDAG